ncbi:MAG: phosphopantetheine-binding protein [Propionibacteriaceae bacterium]|jgi:aryl carrier-like protein|nr:phosphopantetheine-binding protein [Propionibacteriaceae bacterium]
MNQIELAERLRRDIAETLGYSDFDITEDLTGVGLDSIRLMVLIERWRADGVEISFLDALAAPTALGLANAAIQNGTDETRP